jgi:hypothetical protein
MADHTGKDCTSWTLTIKKKIDDDQFQTNAAQKNSVIKGIFSVIFSVSDFFFCLWIYL